MAKSSNQKLRILYLLEMLYEQTDEFNYITIKQIIDEMNSRDVHCERKTVYDDIEALKLCGIDIISQRYSRETGYYLASRNFDTAEIKMLVDIVQASKFVTKKKSDELINKLAKLCSKYERSGLEKQLYLTNSDKNVNEKIFYTVDMINTAIINDMGISFKYVDYFYKGEAKYRRDGEVYLVSPYKMVWDDENYYLIAYDELRKEPRHYRVDKMMEVKSRPGNRKGKDIFKKLDYSAYLKRMFGMYSGEEKTVTFRISKNMIKVFIDRFGSDIMLLDEGGEHVSLNVKIDISKQFYGWLAGLGNDVEIKAPEAVRVEFKNYLENILQKY